jgi:capsular exopolysaccharide synthesis family protein
MHLRDLGTALVQRARLLAGVTLGVTFGVIVLTLLITPVYESEASLRVKMDASGGLGSSLVSGLSEMSDVAESLPLGFSLPGGLGETDVQTEIGVLGSRRILESLADSLALHVSLSRPWGGFRTHVLRVFSAGEDAPQGTYTLRRQSDGTYSVRARGTRERVELPARVRIGEPFDVGPMRLALVDSLAADPPSVVRFEVKPFRRMMRSLRRQVKIERSGQGSRLIEIRYRNADPYLAQGLVNGMVHDFVDYSLSTSQSDSRRRVEILDEEVRHYRTRLAEAESLLQSFQERARVIAPEEQATQQVRRIAEIQVLHDAAQVERDALANVLAVVEARPVGPSGETPYRSLASFPSFLTNQGVQQLLLALSDLENQRTQMLVRRTEVNADVRALNGRIREIEEQLHSLATEYLDGLEEQIASTGRALLQFGAELESIPAVELEYVRLTRDQRLLSEVYVILHAQLVDAQVQQAIDDAQVRVVDQGVIEDRPAFPRRSITFALAGIMGLMVGLFTVVSVETSNPTVRTSADAMRITGTPVLARVPWMRGRRNGPERALVLREAPAHAAAEKIRALALQVRSGNPPPRVVVLAGMTAREGRSTLAANVAIALARQGARTALLEADLRSPVLGRWFGVRDARGWPEVAAIGEEIASVARRVEEGATGGFLDLFAGGHVAQHPLEVLVSKRVPALLESLRSAYDVVIVDTPPLAAGHDGAVMARIADASILVARAHEADEAGLGAAAEALRREGKVLGVVLNGVRG